MIADVWVLVAGPLLDASFAFVPASVVVVVLWRLLVKAVWPEQ